MNSTLEFIIKRFGPQINRKYLTKIREINQTIMAKTLRELNFKVGAEVGVTQGGYVEILCRENPNLKLYAVDIWESYPGYDNYGDRIGKYYSEAQEKQAPYNCKLLKMFSADAAEDFVDGSLDFVYIDGAHDFNKVTIDIEHGYEPKLTNWDIKNEINDNRQPSWYFFKWDKA